VIIVASGFAAQSMAWLWTPGTGLVVPRLGVALTNDHVVFVELDYWFRPLRVLLVEERDRMTVVGWHDSALGLRTTFQSATGERFVLETRMWKRQMREIAAALAARGQLQPL
jgi:hypothetical protein